MTRMKNEDWHQRWASGNIGFHRSEINPDLVSWFSSTKPWKSSARCLVPLCGKSLDLAWIASQGHSVTGIEFSPIPIQEFFAQQQLTPTTETVHGMIKHHATPFTLYQGDFFESPAAIHERFDWIYDRAAAVAIDPDKRSAYAKILAHFLNDGGKVLLLTYTYDSSRYQGPPFSLPEVEIRTHFSDHFKIQPVSTAAIDGYPFGEGARHVHILEKK
ncbi:MAG: thiopurine S-methyltransferase [Bdellovibrionota bacterium]